MLSSRSIQRVEISGHKLSVIIFCRVSEVTNCIIVIPSFVVQSKMKEYKSEVPKRKYKEDEEDIAS
jgi:hypothetical protein